MTDRTETFKQSVATLLRSATDAPISPGSTITVSAAAARDLGLSW